MKHVMEKSRFDTSIFDPETQDFVEAKTEAIRNRLKRTAENIVFIGECLTEVKERLEHGQFGEWIEAEFQMSDRMAQRFMRVFEAFKSDNLAEISVAPSALYALAAPSTPVEAREEALARARNGGHVSHKEAREIIDEHKEDEELETTEPDYTPIWKLEDNVRSYLDAYGDMFGGREVGVPERIEILTGMKQHGYGHLLSSGLVEEPYRQRDVKQAVNNVLEQYRQKENGFPHKHGPTVEDAKSDSLTDSDHFPQPAGYVESPEAGARWVEWNMKSGWKCRGCDVERQHRAAGWAAYRHRPTGILLCPACFEKERRTPGSVINALRDPAPAVHARETLHSSESTEWYTPAEYVDAARTVMGRIDLDPASNALANKTVKAAVFYTREDDGLSQEWFGRVFLNPPYGKNGGESNQGLWSHRLIEEYEAGNVEEAILLVNATPGNRWWAPLWDFPICFPDHRIRFYDVDGESEQPPHSSAFVYLGTNVDGFTDVFQQFGPVVVRVVRMEATT